MLSKKAIKLRKRYSKFASILSFLAYDSDYPSNYKNKIQRINYDLITGLQPKAKNAKKEILDLDGINTWKVTVPNSDPIK